MADVTLLQIQAAVVAVLSGMSTKRGKSFLSEIFTGHKSVEFRPWTSCPSCNKNNLMQIWASFQASVMLKICIVVLLAVAPYSLVHR